MKLQTISKFFLIALSLMVLIACEDDHLHDHGDHEEAYGIQIKKGDSVIFKLLNTKIDTTIAKTLTVTGNESGELNVSFLNEDGSALAEVEEEVEFAYTLADTTVATIEKINYMNDKNQFKINIKTKKAGKTQLEIRLDHEGHSDFKTPMFDLEVK